MADLISLDTYKTIENITNVKDDDRLETLITAISKDKSINSLFDELNNLNIKVKSMRNESNRLEELFIDMIKK